MTKEQYMKEALIEAEKSIEKDEVPIGAIIVYEGKIIARAHNLRNTNKSTLAHAEILAIEEAAKVVGDWRLEECEMYVTLEPCIMCAGAILQSRMKKVYFGAKSAKFGAVGSIINIFKVENFNHKVEVESGILEKESAKLLKEFFGKIRAGE